MGFAPPSNAYLSQASLSRPEVFYPLRVWVCNKCWLVQTEEYATAQELFSSNYAYFSSTSSSWLTHSKNYTDYVVSYLGLTSKSFVLEIGSNDGYLLKNFADLSIPCLGIEPTDSTADMAESRGITVKRAFFCQDVAQDLAYSGKKADLIIGNNVYAHVPDLNDFTRGLKTALKADGTITLEFPHLFQLIKNHQFDTVYHEHFSYLSLTTVNTIFSAHGLTVWRVDEIPTHGGSLRIYGSHEKSRRRVLSSVNSVLEKERRAGMLSVDLYTNFQKTIDRKKDALLSFLLRQKKQNKRVVGYGAAAKGNTLLNYAGVKPDLLAFVCDAAAAKQGLFLPGSHIPVVTPDTLLKSKPDFVLILPWNLREELTRHLSSKFFIERFVTVIPQLKIT